ncbi:response regulator [Paenibacillus sp. LMG 31456]|uniref:Response regulator n=1 Tax=Paenibacillus foliorum TaxID=2654974 RepID=A0A972GQD7_9BACL|nr:response regulator [Paenibacillus foliorum]NOU94991.1 response regulator [Paenibacillus foliorum]
MKILVVDDEFFARKAMVQMIQDWNAQVIVYEAENGREAMEQLNFAMPNLVLSDIRMPILDGIELAAFIYEHHPDTANIIISGYDDFKYAQQAIRFKVEHYLLKPVDKEHIWTLLEQYRDKVVMSTEKRLEDSFAALLYEGAPRKSLPLDIEGVDRYAIAVLRMNANYKDHVKQAVKRLLSAAQLRAIIIGDRRYADMIVMWLYDSGGISPTTEWIGEHRDCLKQMIRNWSQSSDYSLSVGMSSIHTDITGLAASYKEAKSALLYRLISGENQVYDAAFAGINRPYNYVAMDEWISCLYQKLMKGQTTEAVDTMRHFMTEAAQHHLSVNVLHDMCAKVTAMLNSVIELMNTRNDAAEVFLQPLDLHEYHSVGGITEEFTQVIMKLGERLLLNRIKTDMIEDIKNYMLHNYKQDILLEDLAKNMYFTDPAYLSRLFKKKTGMGFSQFLLSVRMLKARSMLENDTSLTISEVSSAVGFNDYSYFIQMYKKSFGETPGKYKSGNKQSDA